MAGPDVAIRDRFVCHCHIGNSNRIDRIYIFVRAISAPAGCLMMVIAVCSRAETPGRPGRRGKSVAEGARVVASGSSDLN